MADDMEPSEDVDGFEGLFRREADAIVRTVFLIVGDRLVAEEVMQEAFVQALRNWKKVEHYDRPGAWVRRVAIREAMRVRRRASLLGRVVHKERVLAPCGREVADDVVDVRRAVLGLPSMQRAAIALYYLDDVPVVEIAEVLGCSEGTVKTHLSRGRRTLAEQLREDIDDEPR